MVINYKLEKLNLPCDKVCIWRSGGTAPGLSASAGDECSYVSPLPLCCGKRAPGNDWNNRVMVKPNTV
jgi:hypothetical protein